MTPGTSWCACRWPRRWWRWSERPGCGGGSRRTTRPARTNSGWGSTRFANGSGGTVTSRCPCWGRPSSRSPHANRERGRVTGERGGLLRSGGLPLSTTAIRGLLAVIVLSRVVDVGAAITRALWRQVHLSRALISHYRRHGDPLLHGLGCSTRSPRPALAGLADR
jgi:hypothetical protein